MSHLRDRCCANCAHWRPYRGLIAKPLPFGECALAVADPEIVRKSSCCDDSCRQHVLKFPAAVPAAQPFLATSPLCP